MFFLFLKAKASGDTRTADMFGTHVETLTRKDGVVQKYHVGNDTVAAPAASRPAGAAAEAGKPREPVVLFDAPPSRYGGYTLDQLGAPETYEADDALATFVRRVVAPQQFETHGRPSGIGIGDFKRELLAGKHPALVAEELTKRDEAEQQAKKAKAEAKQAKSEEKKKAEELAAQVMPEFQMPGGWMATVANGKIALSGPYDPDLQPRLKRAGGKWDPAGRRWLLPADKAESLKTIFANAAKASDDNKEQRQRAEAVRWLGYVEEKARDGYLYEKGVAAVRQFGAGHPDLLERLDAAIGKAKEVREKQERVWAAEKLERANAREKERAAHAKAVSKRVLFPVSRGPAINKPTRLNGRPVVFTGTGKEFRIDEDSASVYGHHLLGHEGDRGAYWYYRDATPEEVAQLEASEAARDEAVRERQEREKIKSGIEKRITEAGERPDGMNAPEGRRLLSTANIYGGGDWFVVGPDWIWYVRNNGADGDDWSQNNVSTGGAGGIGWRIPYDSRVAEELDRLDAATKT
jgi:hypothetical protein